MKNRLFLPYPDPSANVPPFAYLKSSLAQQGIEINTIDFWDGKRGDTVIVFNHPPLGLYGAAYRFVSFVRGRGWFSLKNDKLGEILEKFKKRIFIQWESPVNEPWTFKNTVQIAARYDACYSIPSVVGWQQFYYPQDFDGFNRELFEGVRDKFLVMINSANRARGYFAKALYDERARVVEYFAKNGAVVDLYGRGWNRSSNKFIKSVWRGLSQNKPETMSRYKFAICFENARWPGYITEKIFDCFLVGTVPVYLGATDVESHIPADCFIDARKFKDYGELMKFLMSLGESDIARFRKSIGEFFVSPRFAPFSRSQFVKSFLRILEQ